MWLDNEKIIEIYNKLNGNNKFPSECPNCKSESAHIYFHSHKENRCGVWVWCSECGAFAHMSSYTPSWWKNPVFINEDELCSEPTYLESKAVDIDKWVNKLISDKTSENQSALIEDRFNVKFKIDIQGIPSGTVGVLVVKNDFKTTITQFVRKNGETVEISLSNEELLKAVEVLY